MKIIERFIHPFQEINFFQPIRSKVEYARVVVYSARQLLVDFETEGTEFDASMKLVVDKMSRLFFYKGNKYFSISFPFTAVVEGNEVVQLNTYTGKQLNSLTISSVISILDNEQFRLNPSPIDFLIEPYGLESLGLSLLEEILQFEPAYIRYDHDSENENGKFHPLYHLDINYSQCGTFKLGLNKIITKNHFENLQNIKTECSYLDV